MRLAEQIALWLGRVEVVLAGAEDALRDGNDALAAGDPLRARAAAHRLLARVPGSPLGLALLADACEAGGLAAELALTLEELAERVPSRGEVWLRLGRAREATGAGPDDVRDAWLRALAVSAPSDEARRAVLLALADLDLAAGDGARAELWLDRAAPTFALTGRPAAAGKRADPAGDAVDDGRAALALRRAEARLAQGDPAGAILALDGVASDATDARAALARGRALALVGDARAFASLVRAFVLDAPGASELLSSALAWIPTDAAARARARMVVDGKGEAHLARWRAAFARAEGRRDEARAALIEAVTAGDLSAAAPLLEAAIDDRARDALAIALASPALAAPDLGAALEALVADARRLAGPTDFSDPERGAATLDALAGVTSDRVAPWALEAAGAISRAWVPGSGAPARWDLLLARLDAHARAIADLDAVARIAALSAERARPVRVAIVGEFNAGKSTFINALIGADVAPTGVLPTTATLHHLRWAQDAFARILFAPGAAGAAPPERIVATDALRAALRALDPASVRRVEILLPLPSLTRVEILDTPGFNAPDQRHTDTARAAFEEADFAIWLFDAGQAMKQTERIVLEEARAARLPVQILVNKADRLKEGDLPRVMELVCSSLEEVGLRSFREPIALSARLALAGKLGDEAALAASRWAEVQRLLDEEIVARSEELKERALRRRAASIVGRLLAGAADAESGERAAGEEATARAHALSHAAARLDAKADDVAEGAAAALATAGDRWRRELAVVVTGRSASGEAPDRTLARYRVDRALALLAPPLARHLANVANGALAAAATEAGRPAAPTLDAPALAPLVRATVRASAAHAEGEAADLSLLARSAVAALVEHLSALAVAPPPPPRAGGRRRELAALAEALA